MHGIELAAWDRLSRAGFSIGDWRVVTPSGEDMHRVTAAGPLGAIVADAPTRIEAFALALVEARGLLKVDRVPGRPLAAFVLSDQV